MKNFVFNVESWQSTICRKMKYVFAIALLFVGVNLNAQTIIGSEDNTTEYLGATSDKLELADGDFALFKFQNFSDEEENWFNWLLWVKDSNDADFIILRADCWEIVQWSNEGITNNFNWDTFQYDMYEANVTVKCKYLNSQFTIYADITTQDGNKYYMEYTKAATGTLNICLAVDHCHLAISKVKRITSGVVTDESDGWRTLGQATFTDNVLCENSYQVTLQQSKSDMAYFRLVEPYHQPYMLENWDLRGEPDEYMYLTLINKNDKWSFNYDGYSITEPIGNDSLVWFSWHSTGNFYDYSDSIRTFASDIIISHPRSWTNYQTHTALLHNRVLTYQSNGYPDVLQLAPIYGSVSTIGGYRTWKFTQDDSIVLIKFPEIPSEDIYIHTTGSGDSDNPYTVSDAKMLAGLLEADSLSYSSYYIKGVISRIDEPYSQQSGRATFYISEDGNTEDELRINEAYFLDYKSWVEGNPQIKVGDEVIINGLLVNTNGDTPETASQKSYIYSLNGLADISPILTVYSISNSGINYATLIGWRADGSRLGFRLSGSDCYFCGAISSATSLCVPEQISYNGTIYDVNNCGYYGGSVLDFEEATTVTSLTLPKTILEIRDDIPWNIDNLHLQHNIYDAPPSLYRSGYLQYINVWVPQSVYSSYKKWTMDSDSEWYGVEVHYEGWEPQPYIVTVNTPGTLGNVMLSTISQLFNQWNDVDELTVIGHLNRDDMKILSRLKEMRKLDLSQTDITTITGCSGLSKLQEVILPSTVTEIDDNAFADCKKLKMISAQNVITIGNSAFSSCYNLTEVNLPAATTIGSSAFADCSNLKEINLLAATTIGNSAFSSCYNLTEVNLPAATTIGSWAFFDCSNLKEMNLPAATTIYSYAFYDCINLLRVDLPAAIRIDSNAFGTEYYFAERTDRGCPNLRTINLPVVTFIGSNAFCGCNSLYEVNIPNVTEIRAYAFYGCSSLGSINLSSVNSIASEAFYGCSNLREVNFPESLQSIGSDAFYGCNLRDVYCHIVAPLATTAFGQDVASSATLHVPAISLTAYMLSDSWYNFYEIVPFDETLERITINSDFTITDYAGLAEKIDLNINSVDQNSYDSYDSWTSTFSCGHLTVSADAPLRLGTFNYENYMWVNGNRNSWRYPYCNSLITNNEITADEVVMDFCVQTNEWNFISFPFDVNVSDIEVPEGTLWVIRKYSGADRAALTGNTWQNMTKGMTLKAGEGYILHCANEKLNTTGFQIKVKAINNGNKNKIFTYQDVVKPLTTYASEHAHNRSWNLVGNPYPSYYNTTAIKHNGVITVWNGRGYTAFSLLDDDYQLRPNEAFFVQCPMDATSMTFKAEGRTHEYRQNTYDNDDDYDDYDDARLRVNRSPSNSQRLVYNFILTSSDFSDRTRLVINPEAKMDYEISCDASKFMSDDASVPQLYVLDNGIRYAIDERPLGDGIIGLGVRLGETGEYTLQLNSKNIGANRVVLTDHETGSVVNLTEDAYTFTAQAGTDESRFTLTIGSEATGVDEIVNGEFSNGTSTYDLQGRKVNSETKGIYIINHNGKNRKVVK